MFLFIFIVLRLFKGGELKHKFGYNYLFKYIKPYDNN